MILKHNKFYLYHHLIPDTGLIFYIGTGKCFRPFETRKAGRNSKWHNQFKKTGFEVKIIREFDLLSDALKAEIESINEALANNHPLVNTTKGGRGMLGVKPLNYGKTGVFSKAVLKKISDASKENYNTEYKREQHAKKCGSNRMFAMYLGDEQVWKGYSQSKCARTYGMNQGSISNALKGRIKTYRNYTFKYLEES
jgi:hypothetical protein